MNRSAKEILDEVINQDWYYLEKDDNGGTHAKKLPLSKPDLFINRPKPGDSGIYCGVKIDEQLVIGVGLIPPTPGGELNVTDESCCESVVRYIIKSFIAQSYEKMGHKVIV